MRDVLEARAHHDGDQVHAALGPRGDEDVAGLGREARLDAVDPRIAEEQRVAVRQQPLAGAGAQCQVVGVDGAAEEAPLAQRPRQRREVAGAGVVAELVEADRVRVVRVGEAELLRAAVHLADEGRQRVAHPDGERDGGVVGGRHEQRAHEVGDRDLLAGDQADDGFPGAAR